MINVLRAALVAGVLCAAALPAAAQQAVVPAPQEPAAAPAIPEAAIPEAAIPEAAVPGASDLEATVQRLGRDLQSLSEAARQGALDVLNRESPYVVTTDQLVAIATGALVGAAVVDLLGGGGLASLTAAALGGVAGHWIYTQPPSLGSPSLGLPSLGPPSVGPAPLADPAAKG